LYERPVLILKKFNSKIVWVLPMSSKIKSGKYYYQIEYGGAIYTVLLSQLKLMSSTRLIRQVQQIKKVPLVDFRYIKTKLIELISEN
jgi:mRNA interferase MazF